MELNVDQLKGNKTPRHLISLESLFNRHDAYIRRERGRKGGTLDEYEGINVGRKLKPKMINNGSSFSTKESAKAKALLSEYQDVFSWGYEDLKTFRNSEFRH